MYAEVCRMSRSKQVKMGKISMCLGSQVQELGKELGGGRSRGEREEGKMEIKGRTERTKAIPQTPSV